MDGDSEAEGWTNKTQLSYISRKDPNHSVEESIETVPLKNENGTKNRTTDTPSTGIEISAINNGNGQENAFHANDTFVDNVFNSDIDQDKNLERRNCRRVDDGVVSATDKIINDLTKGGVRGAPTNNSTATTAASPNLKNADEDNNNKTSQTDLGGESCLSHQEEETVGPAGETLSMNGQVPLVETDSLIESNEGSPEKEVLFACNNESFDLVASECG